MEKEQFKKWFQKGHNIVKEANLPRYLYKDEMVQFNIIMYSFFNQLIIAQADNINSTIGELNYVFNRIVISSQMEETFDEFLNKFADRYETIKNAVAEMNNDEGIKNLDDAQKANVIIKEIMRMVGTASELTGEEHLRISDMFLLCVQICEMLKFDFNYINYLTDEATKEIAKQIAEYNKQIVEAQQKTEEVKESGEAKEEPADNNN